MFWNRPLTLRNIREEVVGIHTKVPLQNGQQTNYINFDNAASTPTLKGILRKVNEFMCWYSSVHRGSGFKSQLSTSIYDQCHEITGNFVGADMQASSVIFVKNTTEAINKLANRIDFGKKDTVLTTFMEHHSNDLPWRRVARVLYCEVNHDGTLDYNDFERKLKRHKDRIRLVTLTGASNVTGYVTDLDTICGLCKHYGVEVMVDAAQLAPHRRINISQQHIDYIAFSGHKIYAPFGIGVLIGPKQTFQQGSPDLVGGGTVSLVSKDSIYWAGLPDKEEAGTPNIVGAVALAQALNTIERIGIEAIEQHERDLTTYALESISEISHVKVCGTPDIDKADRVGVITFNVEGLSHYETSRLLSETAGIGTRSGCFCAHPYVQRLTGLSNIDILKLQRLKIDGKHKDMPGFVRISFGMYNTKHEIDTLIERLRHLSPLDTIVCSIEDDKQKHTLHNIDKYFTIAR